VVLVISEVRRDKGPAHRSHEWKIQSGRVAPDGFLRVRRVAVRPIVALVRFEEHTAQSTELHPASVVSAGRDPAPTAHPIKLAS
jgi:hypothetical protein